MSKDDIADLLAEVRELVALNRQVLERLQGTPQAAGISDEHYRLLEGLTPKMHVALQMVLAGAGNKTIAEHLRISENTAKVHVRSVAKKLGVNTRAQITAQMLPVMNSIDPKVYKELSRGLPVDWAERVMAGKTNRWEGVYLDG